MAENKNFGSRLAMFATGLGVLIGLGLFTIPAFWEHLESLKPHYITMAKVGAMVGEFMLFCLLLWHSFSKSMKVRQTALALTGVLTIVILVHAAALWGLKDGSVRQQNKEQELQTKLTAMSEKQMAAANGKYKSKNQREIASSAQKQLADEIKNRDTGIHAASFMPEWYMNGPMYLAIFLMVMLAHIVLAYLQANMDIEDIDADFNGIADIKEGKLVKHKGKIYAKDPVTEKPSEDYAKYVEWQKQQGQGSPAMPETPKPSPGPYLPSPAPSPGPRPAKNGSGKAPPPKA